MFSIFLSIYLYIYFYLYFYLVGFITAFIRFMHVEIDISTEFIDIPHIKYAFEHKIPCDRHTLSSKLRYCQKVTLLDRM